MATLNRVAVSGLLDYLDDALATLQKAEGPGLESHAAWCVRMARQRVLDALVQPLVIEQLEAA